MFFKLITSLIVVLTLSNYTLHAYNPQASVNACYPEYSKKMTFEASSIWAKISFDQPVTDEYKKQYFQFFKRVDSSISIQRVTRNSSNTFFVVINPLIGEKQLRNIIDQVNQHFMSLGNANDEEEKEDNGFTGSSSSLLMASSINRVAPAPMIAPASEPKILPTQKTLSPEEILEEEIRRIPGAYFTHIDDSEVNEAIESSPLQAKKIVSRINKGIFGKKKKNVVLYGLPGTGKTTLAKAIAKKCNIPCLFFAAGQLSTSFQSSAEKALQGMFSCALKYEKPCLIVIDELGILIQHQSNHNSHLQTTLNTLWQELDRASTSKIVTVFTLNSRKDLPAPFEDRITGISVPLPTQQARERAIAYHLQQAIKEYGIICEDGLTPQKIAQMTHDFSQRDIENMIEEAVDHAITCNCRFVSKQDIDEAIDSIEAQPARKKMRKELAEEEAQNQVDPAELAKKKDERARIWEQQLQETDVFYPQDISGDGTIDASSTTMYSAMTS